MQSEDEPQYHNASGYVHAGCFAFEALRRLEWCRQR